MMIDSARKLSFYIANELELEDMLSQNISIVTIEDAISRMIDEFMAANHFEIVQNGAEPENRYASKKVHWRGQDGLAHCHTLAKNPRLTTVPDLVNCRRCMPEAMSKND